MKLNKSVINTAIVAVLGVTVLQPVGAASIPDGEYDLVILPTPISTFMGVEFGDVGTDGDWNSTFSFGNLPGVASQTMKDNDTEVNLGLTITPAKGIANDGFAGILRLQISGGNLSVLKFNKDTIFATAGGNFGQSVDPSFGTSQMTGTLDKATGAMVLRPTKRLGNIDQPVLIDQPWLIDDAPATGACNPSTSTGNTTWLDFTTASATNNNGTVNGAPLVNIPDANGDGVGDLRAVLVTGGSIGTVWGTFCGAQFIEIWRVNLLPFAINDASTVSQGASKELCVLDNDGVGGGAAPGATGVVAPTITATGTAALGSVAINAASANCAGKDSLTYTSTGAGTDSFTYTITNSQGQTSTASVSITTSTNPAVAGSDGPFNANQGASPAMIPISSLTSNDSTSAAGATIVDSTIVPASLSANGSAVTVVGANVEYVPPAADFVGADTFTYTVDDSAGNTTDPATVSITVNAFGTTDPGSTYSAGTVATGTGSTNGKIVSADLPSDPTVAAICVGGCYDFVITGASNPTQVVPPQLTLAIADGLIMRKFINGAWTDYDTSGSDTIASAPLTSNGGCPAATDTSWVLFNGATTTTANVGHTCLRYSIADNGTGPGPNDSDGAPGVVADPSGLSAPVVQVTASDLQSDFADNASGGCTLVSDNKAGAKDRADWLMIIFFMGILGLFRKRVS